ncbi:MAG: hypothetical protein JRI89_08640 [Deltaproteobacteria bacterium]|nr:hypothetical protein [Deltaproteobacteria bacterium]
MNRTRAFVWSLIFLAGVLFSGISWAVPELIGYQGKLTDDVGTPLEGTYRVRFYLYNAPTEGIVLWHEEQSVMVSRGIYNVLLGSVNPLHQNIFTTGDSVYLKVAIFNPDTSAWEKLSPRQRLVSTAFAFQAENAQTLNGFEWGYFAPAVHDHSGTDIWGPLELSAKLSTSGYKGTISGTNTGQSGVRRIWKRQ